MRFEVEHANVGIFASIAELAQAAAARAAMIMRNAIEQRGTARIIVATGNSQLEFIDALVRQKDLDWQLVELFHLDEYVGLPENHPASFRRWIRERLMDRVHPGKAHLLRGDAPDLDAELRTYAEMLNAALNDLAFVGIGENGHIAFNDPHVAEFNDPLTVKRVTLDEACRRQQVGEGHFPDLAAVPKEAITVTCPALMRVENWVCCVPERRKAVAVKNSLEGPISEACPGSLVRRHPNTFVYLDVESASLLSNKGQPKIIPPFTTDG